MTSEIGQELSSLTLSQKAVKGAFNPESLDRIAKLMDGYEREFKRVFGSFLTTVSELDSKSGQLVRRFFVPKEYEQQLQGVANSVYQQNIGAGTDVQDEMYLAKSYAPAHMIETTREVKGAKAQQYLKEELVEVGGKAQRTAGTANKDMMTTYIPIMDSDWNSMSKTEQVKYLRGLTPQTNRASEAEQKNRIEKENKRKSEEQEKQMAKEEEQASKEKAISRRATIGKIGKIVTLVLTLIDITRRILTSVMSFGSQLSKDASKASTLEISTQRYKQLEYLDTALGMDKGTNIQAQEDIRSMFGNTANLNTEALKWLAMVMGDKVTNDVLSGLGGDNPEKLNEEIIDSFFQRWQSGQDQYGNQVGQDKARRALVTLLESVSPSIARQLERMIEEQTSGLNAGNIISWSQLQALYRIGSGGVTENDYSLGSLIGKEVDELRANFNALSDTIKTGLLLSLSDFIGWLNKVAKRLNRTETEEYEASLEGREFLTLKKGQYEQAQEMRVQHLESALGMPVEEAMATLENLRGVPEYEWSETDRKAFEGMKTVYNNPVLYNELGMYYATKDKLKEIKKRFDKQDFDIGDKADFSDQALIKLAENNTAMELLNFTTGGVFGATQYNFAGNSVGEMKDYWDRLMTWQDISPDVREDFAYKALNYLQNVNNIPESLKTSDNAEWTGFNKSASEILTRHHAGRTKLSELINTYAGKELTEADMNSEDFTILMDIVTALLSPKSLDKRNVGGLGISDKERRSAESSLLYSAGKYGLDTQEWANIFQVMKEVELEVAQQRYYGNVYNYDYAFTQGEGGKINIDIRVLDAKGRVLDTIQKSASARATSDFNMSYTVDKGYQNDTN